MLQTAPKTPVFGLLKPLTVLWIAAGRLLGIPCHFRTLLFLETVSNTARFVAFLLPFKALTLAIMPERTIRFAGITIEAPTMAIASVILAATLFAVHWLASTRSAHMLTVLFGHATHVAQDSESDDQTGDALDPDAEHLLKTTLRFYAACVIAVVLSTATLLVLPLSAAVLLPLLAVYTAYMSTAGISDTSTFMEPSAFHQLAAFATMLAVLALFGAVVATGGTVGILQALFVFIASRQVAGNFAEMSAVIRHHRAGVLPRFLRKTIDLQDREPRAVSTNHALPDFLVPERQRAWMFATLCELTGNAYDIHAVHWHPASSILQTVFHIDVSGPANREGDGRRTFVLTDYEPKGRAYFRQDNAFRMSFPDHPLTLNRIAATEGAPGAMQVLCDATDFVPATRDDLIAALPEICVSLWSTDVSDNTVMSVSEGDFLRFITPEQIESIRATTDAADVSEACAFLTHRIQRWRELISNLPLTLFHGALNTTNILNSPTAGARLLSWGRVDVEPVGAQLWQIPIIDEKTMSQIIARVSETRPAWHQLTPAHLQLCSQTYGLAQLLPRRVYSRTYRGVVNAAAALRSLA